MIITRNERKSDKPECLGELQRLVDDALALFVVTNFGVALRTMLK